jgi:hypothetical protein
MIASRMARHASQAATMGQALTALGIERRALEVAQEWANAPGQTADRLHAALEAYRGLPARTPTAEIIRGEGLLVERSIDLPLDDLTDWIVQMTGTRAASTWELLCLDLIATPWERARARRVNRLVTSEAALLAALEPRQRLAGLPGNAIHLPPFEQEKSSLITMLQPNYWSYAQAEDRAEVERRALVYVMAVREWQLRHDGRFPDRLEDLVPEVLPSLPIDPYSGRPFGYATVAGVAAAPPPTGMTIRAPEVRWIYSVGPNGRDDHAQPGAVINATSGDIIFPVLPATVEKKGR